MGTDIHFYFEKKENGKWQKVEVPHSIIPDDRNYTLFGFLAGVRNGFGFGGRPIYKAFKKPIFPGRGIPEDSTYNEEAELKNEKGYYLGDHSYSYFYLDELFALNIPDKHTSFGMVSRSEYQKYLEDGYPPSWCAYVVGPDVKIAPNSELFESDDSYTHIEIEWDSNPFGNSYFFDFCKQVLPRFCRACRQEDYRNIRVTFGFDS